MDLKSKVVDDEAKDDIVTRNANILFDQYTDLMKEDLRTIRTNFHNLLIKAIKERTTNKFPEIGQIHEYIFINPKELTLDGFENQTQFQNSYETLQKFVINKYLENLPKFEVGKEIKYKTKEDMELILRDGSDMKSVNKNYDTLLKKNENFIEVFKPDPLKWDGIKKIQKRSKKSRSPGRKKSKKRSPGRKRKSPAKYFK